METLFTNPKKKYISNHFKATVAFVVILSTFFSVKSSSAQCSASVGTQTWTSASWSCNPAPITNESTYTGNLSITGLGAGETLSVNISLKINGNLKLTANGSDPTFRILSGNTLHITGDLLNENNNVIFYVEAGAFLIVDGTLSGKNNNMFGGPGTIVGGTLDLGNNAGCFTGGCPTISFSTCDSGGSFCSNNNNCNTVAGAGTISGSASICAGASSVSYTVPAIANAVQYIWTLPAGATIASGANTRSITINFSSSAVSAIIKVRGSNSCSSGASASFTVTVNSTNSWVGTVSSDWNNSGNWCGGIPSSSQNVVINSGVINMPVINSTASCKDLVINAGASLTVSNGTLNVDGLSTINGSMIFNNAAASATFNNDLTMDGTWTESAANSINFKGNINFKKAFKGKSGIHNLSGGGKSIIVNEKIDVPLLNLNDYTITVNCEVTNTTKFEGTSSTTMIIGPNASFNGGLSFASGKQKVRNLTINKTGDISLSSPLTIEGVLTFSSSGKIKTDSTNFLSLSSSATYTRASQNSFVEGPMVKTMASASRFIFPVGKDTLYRRIGVTPQTSNITAYSAHYIRGNSNTISSNKGGDLYSVSSLEYWLLHKNNSESAKVTLFWGTKSEVSESGDYYNELRVAHYNSVIDIWESFAIENVDLNINTMNSGSITSLNYLSSFSPFTLGATTVKNPLPVELTKFDITKVSESVVLKWQTTSEINNKGFEIQRSADGFKTFQSLGFVKGNGTNNGSEYTFKDAKPLQTESYYRLRQVDFNEEVRFSVVKFIDCSNQLKSTTKLYPNPTSGNVVLILDESEISEVLSYQVISGEGIIKVAKNSVESDWINETLSQDISALRNGVYTIIVINGSNTYYIKLVKN